MCLLSNVQPPTALGGRKKLLLNQSLLFKWLRHATDPLWKTWKIAQESNKNPANIEKKSIKNRKKAFGSAQSESKSTQERYQERFTQPCSALGVVLSRSWDAPGLPRTRPGVPNASPMQFFHDIFEHHFPHYILNRFFGDLLSIFGFAKPQKSCSRPGESRIFTKPTFAWKKLDFIENSSWSLPFAEQKSIKIAKKS